MAFYCVCEDDAPCKNVAGKPNSIVIIIIEKCVDLPAMVNNETSNPYIEIKSRGKRYKTQTIKETIEPVFQERISGMLPSVLSNSEPLITSNHAEFETPTPTAVALSLFSSC